jgi:hypothetical protein
MNCCRETTKMGVLQGNRRVLDPRLLEQYVAGADTRGRQEGRPYPWSQQVIRDISGLSLETVSVTGGGMKMSDPEFVCAACDTSHESHAGDVMTECRVCARLHCSECVDEFGRCIECSKD